jgi:hypothetical protein
VYARLGPVFVTVTGRLIFPGDISGMVGPGGDADVTVASTHLPAMRTRHRNADRASHCARWMSVPDRLSRDGLDAPEITLYALRPHLRPQFWSGGVQSALTPTQRVGELQLGVQFS